MQFYRSNKGIDEGIVKDLKDMIDANNVHAQAFRMARDMLQDVQFQDVKLKLISDRNIQQTNYVRSSCPD
jgi:hypothetical protein